MAREDDNFVAPVLQADGGVDDKTLRAADAQIRVQEDDRLLFCHLLGHGDDFCVGGGFITALEWYCGMLDFGLRVDATLRSLTSDKVSPWLGKGGVLVPTASVSLRG